MSVKSLVRYILIVCAVVLVLVSCSRSVPKKTQASSSIPTTANILLVGNSYTYFNDGIDKQLIGLAPSSTASRVALGGYALEQHWNDPNTLQMLRRGGWGYVVLQEQSQIPIFDPSKFREFAGAFDQEIKKLGGKTVLLMTWERPDSVDYGVTTANLANAYNTLGQTLGANVAPAGLAFERSLRNRSDLVLYSNDGHPTVYGTYLAACILYSTIFDRSPIGNPYSDATISPEIRAYFQKIAAETLGY